MTGHLTVEAIFESGQAPRPGQVKRVGRISDLHFDSAAQKFTALVSYQTSVGLPMSSPVVLDLEVRTIKVLASTIKGWLFGPEMELLFDLAKDVPGDQVIVEIGSFCGRSTVCLGWGSRLGNAATVYAVDTHQGSEEHQDLLRNSVGTLPFFRANMERAALSDLVVPLVLTSEEASRVVTDPIGLLFIDGNHNSARQDLELWYPRLVPGAIVAFHDSIGGGWPAVETDVQGLISENGLLEKVSEAATITVCRKPIGGEA